MPHSEAGACLHALAEAKKRGVDWYLATSWPSDQHEVFVLILRKPGAKIGQPMVGPLEDVLSRAATAVSEVSP